MARDTKEDKKAVLGATTVVGASAGAVAIAAAAASTQAELKPNDSDCFDTECYLSFFPVSDVFQAIVRALLVENLSDYKKFDAHFLMLFGQTHHIHARAVHFHLSTSYPSVPDDVAGAEPENQFSLLSQLITHVWRTQVLKVYHEQFEGCDFKTDQTLEHLAEPSTEYLLATMSRMLGKRIIFLKERLIYTEESKLLPEQQQLRIIFGNNYKETIFVTQSETNQLGFLTTRSLRTEPFVNAKKKLVIDWQDPRLEPKDQKPLLFQRMADDVQKNVFKFFSPQELKTCASVGKAWKKRIDAVRLQMMRDSRFSHLTPLAWQNFKIIFGKNEKIAMTLMAFSERCAEHIRIASWKEKIQVVIKHLRKKNALNDEKNHNDVKPIPHQAGRPNTKVVDPTEQRLNRLLIELKEDQSFYRKVCSEPIIVDEEKDAKAFGNNNALSWEDYKNLLDYIRRHPELYPPIVTLVNGTEHITQESGNVDQLINYLLENNLRGFTAYLNQYPHLLNAHDQFYVTPLFWVQLLNRLQPQQSLPPLQMIDQFYLVPKFWQKILLPLWTESLIEQGARILPNTSIIAGDYLALCVRVICEKGHKEATIFAEIIVEDLNDAKELTDNSNPSKPPIISILALDGIRKNLPFGNTIRKLLQKGLVVQNTLLIDICNSTNDLFDLGQDNRYAAEIFSILLNYPLCEEHFTDPTYYEVGKMYFKKIISLTCRAVVEVFFRKYPDFCRRVVADGDACLLHCAAGRIHFPFIDFATIDFLLAQGCNPLQKNQDGRTILHLMVEKIHIQFCSSQLVRFQTLLSAIQQFITRYPGILKIEDDRVFIPAYHAVQYKNYALLPLFDLVLGDNRNPFKKPIKKDDLDLLAYVISFVSLFGRGRDSDFLATLNYFLTHPIENQVTLLEKIFFNLVDLLFSMNYPYSFRTAILTALEMLLDHPQLRIDKTLLITALKRFDLADEPKKKLVILLITKNKMTPKDLLCKDLTRMVDDAIHYQWYEFLIYIINDKTAIKYGGTVLQRFFYNFAGFTRGSTEFFMQAIKKYPDLLSQKFQYRNHEGCTLFIIIAKDGSDELFKFAHSQRDFKLNRDDKIPLESGIVDARIAIFLNRPDVYPFHMFQLSNQKILRNLNRYEAKIFLVNILKPRGQDIFEQLILHPNNDQSLLDRDEFENDTKRNEFHPNEQQFIAYFSALRDIYRSENKLLGNQFHKNHFMIARKKSTRLLDRYFRQVFGMSLKKCYRYTDKQKGMLLQCPAILQTENPENLILLGIEYGSGFFVQQDSVFAEACYVKAQTQLKNVAAEEEKQARYINPTGEEKLVYRVGSPDMSAGLSKVIDVNLKQLRRTQSAMDAKENPKTLVDILAALIALEKQDDFFANPFAAQLKGFKELLQNPEKPVEDLLLFYWKLKSEGAPDKILSPMRQAIVFTKQQALPAVVSADTPQAAGAGATAAAR